MKTNTLTYSNLILVLGLYLCSFLGFSQSSQTFSSSGTWTCPAGVTTITVEAWGAGGAGGGNASNRDGGGGGGGGAYSKSTTISVTPGVTYTVNVGTGGTGTAVDGTAGGDSWFNSTSVLLAKGGAGGISGTLVSGAAGGNGGAAGSGVGTTKFSGGRGGAGRNNSTGRGGPGGSSAGTAANGTSGAATWSTITAGAAPAGGGMGGDGGDSTLDGNPGTIPGGGGGGAGERVSSTIFTNGGDGADGQVIISWSCGSTNTITLSSSVGTNSQTRCINTAITNITYTTTGATGATFSGLPAGVTGTWASNIVTISGTPTASGTFNYTVSLTGGCGTATANGTITVTPANTITLTSAVGTNAQTRCVNTAITNIIYATTGATGATFSGLPAGVTGAWASNVVTISGTPTASGTFNYTVTLTGGCGAVTATGTITVTLLSTATLTSAVGTNAQSNCINTAITNITYTTTGATGATFSGLPTGVSGTWASNVVTISGTPTASGTFNYTVTLTGGCGAVTATGTITVTPANTVALTSAVGTNAQTRCISTAITNITYATTGATGATFSGLPAGVTGSWASNVVTITGTPIALGTFNYTVTLTGGCGTVTATGTITVTLTNTVTLTSAVGTNAQTRCINTAITNITYTTTGATGATFSGLPAGVSGAWASNVVTISGAPTASGTFNYTVTLTGGCGTTATGTITVNPTNTIVLSSAVGTNAQTRCINTAITNITYATTGATDATFSGLPAGVTGAWASNVITISGTPTASGTFNYTVTLTGGCGAVTATGTITVTPANTATLTSAVGTNAQTRCINTGITNITYATTRATGATFSGLPAGVNGNWASNVVTISGTPTASGTFNYTVTLTGGCGAVTATGTITVTPTNSATLTSAIGTNAQSSCINTAITNITYATTGATGATFSGLPTGVSGTWASNVITISGTPTVSGTFNYTVNLTGGCGAVTATGTITVNTFPTVTGTTPRTRTGAGSVILGATASIGTLNWYDSLTGGTLLGSGTSFVTPVISTTTTFYVEAVNGVCSSSPRTAVVATINYPEIDIQGNATSITSGDVTPSTSDWTDFGTNVTRTFTIRNIGSALLTLGTVMISGVDASDFTVTTETSGSVAIGSSTSFVITFNPSSVGLKTATVSIDTNDTDENPYTFDIQGTGVTQEIDIQGNAISINNGDNSPSVSDWTDFSTVAGTRTFTIRNTGNMTLNIDSITFTGTNASEFTVTTPPSATVGAYGTTTFTVTFAPTAINNRTATINIANNDSNENPYTFALQGFGVIPEIDIQGNTISIVDGDTSPSTTDWTDFGSTNATRTFTIYNNGNIALTLGAITIGGTNASEFTVLTAPAATVAAFSNTTFTIRFIPTAIGTRSATFAIVNNDSGENPYNFNLQGTGTSREIDVQGNSLSIVNGDAVTSISDGTDFGPADINLATVTRTFTILNTGSLSLTISNPTITGVNASEFSISTNPSTLTIGAGSSTTFSVTFNPSAVFTRSATINIVSNDSDENPYTFSIQGTGLLDNDGDGINNNADSDDDNDGIIDTVECGSCISDIFVNGSFETPVIGTATYAILPTSSVTGWQTSAEDFIEIWSSGMNGGYGAVPAAAGNQFAELNANIAGILYQTFCLNGAGGTINWSIKHRGRAGSDQAFVKFGDNLTNAIASTPIVTMVDGNTSWGSYSGTYSIPLGQTSIVLTFQAGYTASGDASIGNLIDDVQIIINQNCIDTDSDGIADINDVDSDNDGIPDIEEGGFKQYSNNTATMDKTNVANWRDTNANGLTDYIDSMISASTYIVPDTDGDGIYNYLDLDSDNDTLWDVNEAGLLNGDGDINDDAKGDGLDAEGDGLLNLYDNSTVFGSAFRPYAQDSDSNGIADYLQLDSNDDGVNDIQTGLYGSFDSDGDGKIDGSGDIDRDGIVDTFDTDDALRGSPRDLNRKLFLDFDGRNDYAENTAILGGLANASLMAWIDLNSAFSGTGTVVGQDKFHIKISSTRTLQAVVNGTTLTFGTALNRSQWYHVAATYGSGSLKLYLNGKLVATQAIAGNIAADASKLTLGKDPLTSTNYFKGKIDEVRVFNVTLTNTQVERMVYQEIQNTASQVRGAIVPKDVGSLPFANVLRYYRMDTYKDDIVDDLTTATVDTGTGMKLYNHKVINYQQAPMPFTTIRTGTFSTAVHDATKDIRGLDVLDYDYSIIQVKHNITETANSTDLGMFVDPGVTVRMTNDTKLQNDWYLDLDGKIDLVGKSQLVQTINSDLEVTSAGSIERDQEGQSNKYNYNYWSSPVGALSTTSNNNAYTVDSVMKDGTDPNNIKNITWVPTYDGAATNPITLSSYWIFKFQNVSPVYANWAKIGQTGSLSAGQGFTLKGSAAGTATQNYTFVGKPNSGTISSPIAANNSNLSGNPYPSALDANAFINDNLTSTTGTLYFWEHYSTNSSHVLVQYQGGYATRNLVGATAPVSPAGISGLGSSTRVPGRYIPVGQGFFVNGSATGGTINFNNGQRAFVKEYDETNSNPLFRQSVSSVVENEFNNKHDAIPSETEFTKIRLGFNSANDFHRQLLLGFMDEKATSGIDAGYDATLFDIQPNDMYFLNTNTKLVIQGDGYFNASNVFPLGVKTAVEGKVKFTLDAIEKLDENQNVYIYDNVTNEYHDIRNKNFEVSLPAGIISDRFSLRFKNTSALGVNNFDDSQTIAVAFTNNNNSINIKNDVLDRTVKTVTLYNILGQSISTWDIKNENQTKIEIPVTNISTGTYIVKVHTTKGDVNKKIIIK